MSEMESYRDSDILAFSLLLPFLFHKVLHVLPILTGADSQMQLNLANGRFQ